MRKIVALLLSVLVLAGCGGAAATETEQVAVATPTPQPTVEPTPTPTPTPAPGTYGSDKRLDDLYDRCADGETGACDELYWDSPVGSEYETFAQSHTTDTNLVDTDNAVDQVPDETDEIDPELEAEIAEFAFRTVIADTIFSYEEARDIADTVCDSLDGGMTIEEVQIAAALAAIEEGLSDTEVADVGGVMGAGIVAFCPEHQTQIDRL